MKLILSQLSFLIVITLSFTLNSIAQIEETDQRVSKVEIPQQFLSASHQIRIDTAVEAYDMTTPDPVNQWDFTVNLLQAHDANVNPISLTVKQRQALLVPQKLAIRANTIANPEGIEDVTGGSGVRNFLLAPKVGVEMSSTYNSGASSVPDGAAAASGNGYIVVGNNTHFEYYTEDGTLISSLTEKQFFGAAANTAANQFDPKIIYNTSWNRFIVVDLEGSNNATTRLLVAFSKTSNPSDGWWIYSLNSNSGGHSSLWFDYPTIGYTEEDLVVGGNMYTNGAGGTYSGARVVMMNLDDGFNGNSLSNGHFELDTDDSYRMHPCSYPFGTYGPGAYLLKRNGSDELGLWDITDNLSGSPTLDVYSFSTEVIDLPVNAPQGSSGILDVSWPIQSVFYAGGGVIYFTFTGANSSLDDRLAVGHINVTNGVVDITTFGAPGWDYAYPRIYPWATDNLAGWDGSLLVSFLRVSSTSFPSFRCVYLDSDFSWGNSVSIKEGESWLANGGSTNTTGSFRWGDYIGGGWVEWAGQPEFWVYGQYGKNNDHAMWVAQVSQDIIGCTDSTACNYDSQATVDDGSCEYDSCAGCTDAEACNYNSNAVLDDDSCTYPGCTDLFACNYQSGAGCSDGSCCYDSCVDLEMPIGLYIPTLGINTMLYYTLSDNNSGADIESGNNFGGSVKFCLEPGCYHMDISGAEVSWTLSLDPVFIFSGADYTIETGTGPSSFDFIVGDGGETAGCTDPLACNYDASALCDNNSCCYEGCLTINMTDSYGDGWNGVIWEVVSMSTGDVVDTGSLDNGLEGIDLTCLSAGCYTFRCNVNNGIYTWEPGWTIVGADGGDYSGDAYDEVVFTILGGGSDLGCTEVTACNYSYLAVCDLGFCCYDNCGVLTMMDTYGDGWNGAYLTITDDNAMVIGTYTFDSGYSSEAEICLLDGCYNIDVSDGSWPSEVGWIIQFPNHMLGGGALYNEQFNLYTMEGCTDENSCNYNPEATCDNGSCLYDGCGDVNACNYDPVCDICHVEELCNFSCVGCTYIEAINYGGDSVTQDNGTCEFAASESCEGDLDGDGQVNTHDLLMFLAAYGAVCI
jgi:hypothetical protein